jgi:hypothetical protein
MSEESQSGFCASGAYARVTSRAKARGRYAAGIKTAHVCIPVGGGFAGFTTVGLLGYYGGTSYYFDATVVHFAGPQGWQTNPPTMPEGSTTCAPWAIPKQIINTLTTVPSIGVYSKKTIVKTASWGDSNTTVLKYVNDGYFTVSGVVLSVRSGRDDTTEGPDFNYDYTYGFQTSIEYTYSETETIETHNWDGADYIRKDGTHGSGPASITIRTTLSDRVDIAPPSYEGIAAALLAKIDLNNTAERYYLFDQAAVALTWLPSCSLIVSAASIAHGGYGYHNYGSPSDIGAYLTAIGGTGTPAVMRITSILFGPGTPITGISLYSSGNYTVAPPRPCPVSGGRGADATVNLDMDEPLATGYNIYRAELVGGVLGSYSLVGSNVPLARWIDTTAAYGHTYYYTISAILVGGIETAQSAPVVVTLSALPSPPINKTFQMMPTMPSGTANSGAPQGLAAVEIPSGGLDYTTILKLQIANAFVPNQQIILFPTSEDGSTFVISQNVSCGTPSPFFLAARGLSGSPVSIGVSGATGYVWSKSRGFLPGNSPNYPTYPPPNISFQEKFISDAVDITGNFPPLVFSHGRCGFYKWQLTKELEFTFSDVPTVGKYLYYL